MSDIPPTPSAAEYARAEPETDEGLFGREEPFGLFADWFADAKLKEINDANGMALATVDADGLPDVRMVLLKDFSQRGFAFYTNLDSDKGRQIAANPRVALLFHWKSLRRQVRVRGPLQPVSEAEADAYFAGRARDTQIGCWASDQSRSMESRAALRRRIAEHGMRFAEDDVPRPPTWSGFRVTPLHFEFWRDRPFRLHDRLTFDRADTRDEWRRDRLYP